MNNPSSNTILSASSIATSILHYLSPSSASSSLVKRKTTDRIIGTAATLTFSYALFKFVWIVFWRNKKGKKEKEEDEEKFVWVWFYSLCGNISFLQNLKLFKEEANQKQEDQKREENQNENEKENKEKEEPKTIRGACYCNSIRFTLQTSSSSTAPSSSLFLTTNGDDFQLTTDPSLLQVHYIQNQTVVSAQAYCGKCNMHLLSAPDSASNLLQINTTCFNTSASDDDDDDDGDPYEKSGTGTNHVQPMLVPLDMKKWPSLAPATYNSSSDTNTATTLTSLSSSSTSTSYYTMASDTFKQEEQDSTASSHTDLSLEEEDDASSSSKPPKTTTSSVASSLTSIHSSEFRIPIPGGGDGMEQHVNKTPQKRDAASSSLSTTPNKSESISKLATSSPMMKDQLSYYMRRHVVKQDGEKTKQ